MSEEGRPRRAQVESMRKAFRFGGKRPPPPSRSFAHLGILQEVVATGQLVDAHDGQDRIAADEGVSVVEVGQDGGMRGSRKLCLKPAEEWRKATPRMYSLGC